MKRSKLKILLHWFLCTVFSFLIIYLFVFLGGWKLIESGDVVMLELVAALGMGFIIWIIYEMSRFYEAKIKELEDRITNLENKQ